MRPGNEPLFRKYTMTFSTRAIEIPYEEIDRTSETFLLSPGSTETQAESQRLGSSIDRVGVLSPPLLMQRGDGSYQVVTGWHRIAAHYARFGNKPILCLVLAANTRAEDCLVLALEDILWQRQPTAVEIAIFFSKTARQQGGRPIIERYLSILNLPANRKTIDRYLSLLQLEEPIIMAVHDGQVNERLAFELAALSIRDRLSIFEVVDRLHLSVSNQKKLYTGVAELAGRRKTSFMDVLADDEAMEILNHSSANIPQKTAKLMAWLERERLPRLHEAEKDFQQLARELRLPEAMRLEHALSFERDSLTLSLTFANAEHLKRHLPQLKKLLSSTAPPTAI